MGFPEILDYAAARISASLKDQPKVQSRLYRVIGEIFFTYRANEKALVLHRESLRIRRSIHAQDHRDLVDSLSRVAELTGSLGNKVEADTLASEALEMARRLYPSPHEGLAQALSTLATIRMSESNWTEGESLFRKAIAVRGGVSSEPGTLLAADLNKLAKCVGESGRLDEAVVLHREAIGILTNLFGENYHSVTVSLTGLAETLVRRGDFDEAETMYRRAYAVALMVFPELNTRVARSRRSLESFYRSQGREGEFAAVEIAIRESVRAAKAAKIDPKPALALDFNELAEEPVQSYEKP